MLSLCMIVKDEEKFLPRCLNSVRDFVDEIIIVDTGSKDMTKLIARNFTRHVFDFEWNDDFSAARNFSIEKAGGDWILVLDADEAVAPEDMKRIVELTKGKADAYRLELRNYSDDDSRGDWVPAHDEWAGGSRGYRRVHLIRLFRSHLRFSGAVHETVNSDCQVADIPIHHYGFAKAQQEKHRKYMEIAKKALAKKPTGRLHYTVGSYYFRYDRDYEKAREHFEKAATFGDDILRSKEALAGIYIRLGEYQKAYDIYRELCRTKPTARTYRNLGNLLAMSGHEKAALRYLKMAVEKGHPRAENIKQSMQQIEAAIRERPGA